MFSGKISTIDICCNNFQIFTVESSKNKASAEFENCHLKYSLSTLNFPGNMMTSKAQVRCKVIETALLYQFLSVFGNLLRFWP